MDNADRLAGLKHPQDVKDIMKGIRDSFVDVEKSDTVQKTTFSPSRLAWGSGGCPRYWHLLFEGTEYEETITSFAKNNMQNGTDSHERLQAQIEAGPLDVVCEEQLQHNDPPINSYCDVIVNYEDRRVPIEIKTCNDTAFEYRMTTKIPADYHVLQLLIYMVILKSKLGFIMYENKNNYQKVMIPVHMDAENKKRIDDAFEWMRLTRKAFDENELPKYFKSRRKNSKICGQCPVKKACDARGEGVVDIPLLKDYNA